MKRVFRLCTHFSLLACFFSGGCSFFYYTQDYVKESVYDEWNENIRCNFDSRPDLDVYIDPHSIRIGSTLILVGPLFLTVIPFPIWSYDDQIEIHFIIVNRKSDINALALDPNKFTLYSDKFDGFTPVKIFVNDIEMEEINNIKNRT